MKNGKTIVLWCVVLLFVLGCILIVGATCAGCFALFDTSDYAYNQNSGWEASDASETFTDVYLPRYQRKLDELIETYGIDCLQRSEHATYDEDTVLRVYLYNEQFTLKIFIADRGYYGDFEIGLFYYGVNGASRDYEAARPYVQLINDFTRYVAYDTKREDCDNHFERLYEEGLSSQELRASYTYHFDDWVGYVGYHVSIDFADGYHYLAAEDSDAEKRPCMSFSFEGILQPLSDKDE